MWREGEEVAAFYGSFHEARPNERLVQTFTWEGMPDGVSLDTMTFTDLGDGRTRVSALSVLESFEARDGMVASGMEAGVFEGYAKLDALLAESSNQTRTKQPWRWSSTRPTACISAYAVVGPTNRIPAFLSSRAIATDSGEVARTSSAEGRGRPVTA